MRFEIPGWRPRRHAAFLGAALFSLLFAIVIASTTTGPRTASASSVSGWATISGTIAPEWGPDWENATGEPDGQVASRDVDGEGQLRLHAFPLVVPSEATITGISFTIHAQTNFDGVDGTPNPACYGLPSARVTNNPLIQGSWSPVEFFDAAVGPGLSAHTISGSISDGGPWGREWEPSEIASPFFTVDIFVQVADPEACDQEGMQFEVDAVLAEVSYALPVDLIITKLRDLNGDGTPDAPEVSLEGWRFDIYSAGVAEAEGDVGSGTTNAEGTLSVALPGAGTYTVCETLDDEWANTWTSGSPSNDPAGNDRPCADVVVDGSEEGPVTIAFANSPPSHQLRVCKILQRADGTLLTTGNDETASFPSGTFSVPLEGPYDYQEGLAIPSLPYEDTVNVTPETAVLSDCVTRQLPEGSYTYGDEVGAANEEWEAARFHETSTGATSVLADFCEYESGPAICDGSIDLNQDTTLFILNQAIEQDAVETTTPETTTPETSTPETSTPETSTPETTTPETSTPETTTPETSTPETTTPETSTPETSTPETSTPETSTPETSTPETTTPETSTPATSTPETSTPETMTPETSTPETMTPETSTPETMTPETSTPETSTPETSTPETATPAAETPTSVPPTAEPTPALDTRDYTLHFRWSLISWLSPAMTIEDALKGEGSNQGGSNVFDQVTAILLWDHVEQNWLAFFPSGIGQPGANDFETLQPGGIYWIAIAGPDTTTWTVIDPAANGDD